MKQTMHTRRQFLRTSMLGAAATWTLPVFLEKTFFALDAMAADALNQIATRRGWFQLCRLQFWEARPPPSRRAQKTFSPGKLESTRVRPLRERRCAATSAV